MKRNYISIRAAVTAIGALCGAIMLPSISHATGSVVVNGGQVCASSTNMALTPAGDISINCIAPTTGTQPTSAPSCSVNVSASPITVGTQSNISAICNPAATGYTWTVSNGGPAVSGAGAVVSFTTQGSFTYTVQGSNSVGTGPVSAGVAVVVTASTGGGPVGGNCTNTAVAGVFAGNGIRNLAIDRGSWVAYELPAYSAGRTLEILSVQSTSSQSDLTSEFSVSTCPGDFTAMQPECRAWGTVNQSGTQLYAAVRNSVLPGTCSVVIGTKYYINVRNTKSDYTTPACTPQTCYMILQLNSY